MRIQEIMTTDPACCLSSEPAAKAAGLMKELNVGVVPIVEGDKLVGIVTDRDLCMEVVAESKDANATPLSDCMSRDLICCQPNDDVEDVMLLMQDFQVRRIPVVDEEQHLAGIVSMADLALNMPAPEELGETLKDISEPPEYPL